MAAAAAAAGFVVEAYFVDTSLGAVPDLGPVWKLFMSLPFSLFCGDIFNSKHGLITLIDLY